MNEWVLLFACGVVILLVLIVLVVVMQSRHQQEVIVREMALRTQQQTAEELLELREKVSRELLQFELQMSQSLKNDLNQLQESTGNTLSNLEHRMNQSMTQGLQATNQAFTEMMQQMVNIQKTQENLDDLAGSLSNLQSILQDKKSRGIFGEVQLYSLLESVYGVNDQRYQKQYKLENGTIVDAMVFAPEPLGKIAIDSKFPLENYNRMFDDNLSALEKQQAAKLFKQDVIKHIKDIHMKYVKTEETAEFAYMFVPAEAVFAYIYGKMDDVVQLSYQYKVYIVSPTTLMAYMTAIQAIYLGQQRNEKMEWMQREYAKLAQEFERFASRFETMMKDYDKLYKDMQSVSITSDKIQHRFEKISNTDVEEL